MSTYRGPDLSDADHAIDGEHIYAREDDPWLADLGGRIPDVRLYPPDADFEQMAQDRAEARAERWEP